MKGDILAKKIAYYRKLCDLTQSELAEMLDVSCAAVSKWEQGSSCPDILLLPKIADIFGISTDELFGRTIIKEPVYSFVDSLPWEDNGKLRIGIFHGQKMFAQSTYEIKDGENKYIVSFDGAGYSLKGKCIINKS